MHRLATVHECDQPANQPEKSQHGLAQDVPTTTVSAAHKNEANQQ